MIKLTKTVSILSVIIYLTLYDIYDTQLMPNIVEPKEGLFSVPICELCKREQAVYYTAESVYTNKFENLELVGTCAEFGCGGARL